MQLFRRTISTGDESNRHAVYTLESPHPSPKITTPFVQKIFIPDADYLIVNIDERSQLDNDAITFYLDEDLTKQKRNFRFFDFSMLYSYFLAGLTCFLLINKSCRF